MKLIRAFGFMVCCCFASVLHGASIPVPNFSFENPDVADGTSAASIPGWTITVLAAHHWKEILTMFVWSRFPSRLQSQCC